MKALLNGMTDSNRISIYSKFRLGFSLLSVLLVAACQSTTKQPEEPIDLSGKHWSYEGEKAPERWGEMTDEFWDCAEGHLQSPIDIKSYAASELPAARLEFQYHPSPVDLVNNGHTVQANIEEENTIRANDHDYLLRQVHFHEPSEHHLDGMIYPMEMHMVHSDTSGKLAVIGVFIKEGPSNEDLESIMDALPEGHDTHKHLQKRCDVVHLLPEDRTVFHYSGSLTTPPCSEGVEWFVMGEPVTLSPEQIQHFRSLFHGNNRPVQNSAARNIEVTRN